MSEKIYFDFPVPQSDSTKLDDVKDNLENNIKGLTITLSDLQKQMLFDPIESCDKADQKMMDSNLEKLVDFYLKNDQNLNLPNNDEEIYIELYKTLIERNNHDKELIEYLTNEIKQDENEILEMTKSLEYMKLENEDENNDDNSTVSEMLNIKVLNDKISGKFVEVRRYLHKILESVHNENMSKLIRKLTEAYFKNGNERFITIEDEDDMECITTLYQASLITYDPYDCKRIKIDEIS